MDVAEPVTRASDTLHQLTIGKALSQRSVGESALAREEQVLGRESGEVWVDEQLLRINSLSS
jgi:hypothetical protein